jgi:hypothetical protein
VAEKKTLQPRPGPGDVGIGTAAATVRSEPTPQGDAGARKGINAQLRERERPGPSDVGIGAAAGTVPKSGAPMEFPAGTSTKHAYVEEMNLRMGRTPKFPTQRRRWQKAIDEAAEDLVKDKNAASKFVDELLLDPSHVPNDKENMLMLFDMIQKQKARNAAYEEDAKLPPTASDAAKEASRKRMRDAKDALDRVYAVSDIGGTQAGRALAARKAMMADDFTLEAMEREMQAIRRRPLTPEEAVEETDQLRKIADDYAAKEKAFQDRIAELEKQLERDTEHESRKSGEDVWKKTKDDVDQKEPSSEPVDPSDIKALFREQAKNGVKSLDEAVENVHAIVSKEDPSITPRQVRDEFSDYGQSRQPSQEEDAKVLREWRAQSQKLSQLDDALKGLPPKKTGMQRDEPSQRVRELTKQVHDAMKKMGIPIGDPAKRLKSALDSAKTRMKNLIADTEKAIAERKRMVATKTGITYDAEAEALAARLDVLRQQYDDIFGRPELTDEQRLNMTIRAAEQNAKAWEDRLEQARKGDFSTPERTTRTLPSSAVLDAAKARVQAAKDEIQRLHDEAFPPLTEAQEAMRQYKKRLAKQIADKEDKMRRKDFAPKEQKTIDASKDPEAMRLLAKLELTKALYEELKYITEWHEMNIMQKSGRAFSNLWDSARLIMTTGELSYILRQGKYAFMSRPITASKAFANSFRALVMSEETAMAVDLETLQDPLAARAIKAGLPLSAAQNGLSRQDELIIGRWSHKIPIANRFSRAAQVFLNKVRLDMWKAIRQSASKTGEPTIEEDRQYARLVREMTGRGGLGKADAAAVVLGRAMFSPRFLASRVQLLVGHAAWSGTATSRKAVVKEYGRMLIGLGVYYSILAFLFGRDDDDKKRFWIGMNPLSTDFGKVRLGDTVLDPLAGLSQVAVFISRTLRGKKVTTAGKLLPIRGTEVPYGGDKWSDVAARFAWSKAHPVVGALRNLFDGTDWQGEETNVPTEVGKFFAPITYVDIYMALKENDIDEGTAFALLAILGEGLQVQKKKQKKTLTPSTSLRLPSTHRND